jgi:hypothetical protein
MASPTENSSVKAGQIESAPPTEPEKKSPEPKGTRVIPPGPGRIVTGAGLAGSQL